MRMKLLRLSATIDSQNAFEAQQLRRPFTDRIRAGMGTPDGVRRQAPNLYRACARRWCHF
ncbi:hypothetical protein DEM27_26720 [Metarhizobium album]|uniref:Uncharacterized protein n=1 Tax=Metarhizobium album TaxID=2182425 RepID=A0A2U2DJ50_9HYPH|nr:hypothetical protein DEM27_26720 [Rhizobium album]